MKGKLISFEGGEGSGKSTQSKLLFNYLISKNISAIHTREPGGTESAEKIRNILVTGNIDNLDKKTEVLLHYAARLEHMKKVVKPALEQGKIVITDRFFDSTYAYQGYGHGVEMDYINKIHDLVVADFKPDLTFIFDIPALKGLERSEKRHMQQSSNENRYESMGLEFHERLRNGFLAIAKAEPNRCKVLNAENDIETLHSKVIEFAELLIN